MPCSFVSRTKLLSIKRPTPGMLTRLERRVQLLERLVPWPALVESLRADLETLRARRG